MAEIQTSVLDQTRAEATGFLNASELFPAGMLAVSYEEKDIMAEINKALDTLNIAMLVLPPEPQQAYNSDGRKFIFFPIVEMKVRIIQNVILNSLPINARQARDIVMMVLQGWMPSTQGVESPLKLAPKPINKAEFPGKVLYDVNFHYSSHLYI